MNLNLNKKYYLIIPIVLSFILSLIITLSNSMPLGWDIYTHINYSLAYIHGGITNVDYLLNAPTGKTIGYPPLFHIMLIVTSMIFGSNMINAAKILQVVLTICNVFAISYVANKFDERIGCIAGILLISSFMFTRFLLPIPETLAMIFFTFSVYFYYKSSHEANYNYSLLVAIFSLIILATHFSSFVYLMILLVILTIIQTIILHNSNGIKSLFYIVSPIILIGLFGLVLLFIVSPSHLTQIFAGFMSILRNPFELFMGQVAMGLERYIRCMGIIPLIFSIIGLYYSFKNKKLLFVSLWGLVAFVITNLHWFGIPVYTFRMLIYLIVPMVILGAYGVINLWDVLNSKDKKISGIFILSLIILSLLFGSIHINDSSVVIYSSSTEQSTFQIAPPTSDEQEVINWFKNESVGNKSILTNNLFFGTVISSIDEIPIHYGFDIYTNKSLSKSSLNSLNKEQIGYILYDKNLIMNNSSKELDVRYVNGTYYPSYYFTTQINKNNFNTIKLQSTDIVFENERFIICKIR